MKNIIVLLLAIFYAGCALPNSKDPLPIYPDPHIIINFFPFYKYYSIKSCSVILAADNQQIISGTLSIDKINANKFNSFNSENYYKEVAKKNTSFPIIDLFENSYSVKELIDADNKIIIVEGIPFKRVVINDKDGNDIYVANYKNNKLVLIDALEFGGKENVIYNYSKLKNDNLKKSITLNCDYSVIKHKQDNPFAVNYVNDYMNRNPLIEKFLLE